MNLHIWHFTIDNDRYTMYALADNVEDARRIALESAPSFSGLDIGRILKNSPIIYDKPASFIMKSGAQLT